MTEEEMRNYQERVFRSAQGAAEKAKVKFPQPNYVTLKIAEESGEIIRAAVHYAEGRMPWSEVEAESIQAIAMILRLLDEGDLMNGIIPPHRQ